MLFLLDFPFKATIPFSFLLCNELIVRVNVGVGVVTVNTMIIFLPPVLKGDAFYNRRLFEACMLIL